MFSSSTHDFVVWSCVQNCWEIEATSPWHKHVSRGPRSVWFTGHGSFAGSDIWKFLGQPVSLWFRFFSMHVNICKLPNKDSLQNCRLFIWLAMVRGWDDANFKVGWFNYVFFLSSKKMMLPPVDSWRDGSTSSLMIDLLLSIAWQWTGSRLLLHVDVSQNRGIPTPLFLHDEFRWLWGPSSQEPSVLVAACAKLGEIHGGWVHDLSWDLSQVTWDLVAQFPNGYHVCRVMLAQESQLSRLSNWRQYHFNYKWCPLIIQPGFIY